MLENFLYYFSDAIVGQVLDELGLQMADELTGMLMTYSLKNLLR